MLLQMAWPSFSGWAAFHCMYVAHLHIHSSVSGHLGGFRVLAIVNHAAMNIGVHGPFWIRVLFEHMPGSGIAGSCDSSIFSFLRTFHAFSLVAAPSSIPTNSSEEFPFLHTPSQALVICWIFDDDHSDWCEVVPHCSFDLHFSNN